ncbi:MAG: hypothetical protein CMJ32_03275 [Phycisphaerae bacterium]|nr:hypothetical protein [Phycisphaerae bacterium]
MSDRDMALSLHVPGSCSMPVAWPLRRSARYNHGMKPWPILTSAWELLLLAAGSGFRMNNRYWKWRHETAFGSDPAKWPSPAQRRRVIMEYGRWVHQIKRGR